MKPSDRYIIVYDWMLQQIGCGTACTLYALLYSFADEHGSVQMAHGYMARRLNASERIVKYAIAELINGGHITVEKVGRGKGICTTYNLPGKRVQNCILIDMPKGDKNVPLSDAKRVQNCILKKGTKLSPNNNINNNNAAEQQDAHARANDSMNTDYNFAEFWELFKPSAEHQSKRISCLNEWARKTDEQRAMMLAILKTGKQHRDNPLFFIRYCDENYTKVVYTRDEIYKQEHTTEPVGYCILEKTDPDGLALWCRTDDAKAMGWNIRREFSA